MGFKREYAEQEDVDAFKLDALVNQYKNSSAVYKHYWVVDKQTNRWLIPVKQFKNSESIWIFHYQDTNIEIKLYKKEDRWDLISIAPNPFNNQEVIHSLREALEVLGDNIIYARKKETPSKEKKKEAHAKSKERTKRKVGYLDILTAIVVGVIIFYITNDTKVSSLMKSDDNKTSNTLQTSKPVFDIYAVVQTSNNTNAIFGLHRNTLRNWSEILSVPSSLNTAQVDKNGNIYWGSWGNRGDNTIYKSDPVGANIKKIVKVPRVSSGLAIDDKHGRLFWSQWLSKKKYAEIGYSDLSGNNPTILLSDKSVMKSVGGMFYDYVYDKLYVCDQSGAKIIVIDLKTKETTTIASSSQPANIVVDYKNRRIIWTDTVSDNITSAEFDGSGKKVLIQFDDKFSNPSALTIDTTSQRLMYAYYGNNSKFELESSNLDGTDRKIEKETLYKPIKSLFFAKNSNTYVASQKATRQKPIAAIGTDKLYDAAKLRQCLACHGQNWSRPALGKSKIVSNMSRQNILRALKGYKKGTYGGPLKGVMKGQVARYTDAELEMIANTISTWQ